MRFEYAALVLAVLSASQPAWVVEGRLNSPAVARLLQQFAEDTPYTCPRPPSGNIECPEEASPVKCGENKCSYFNGCVAEAAGWVVQYACTSAVDDIYDDAP
jgi:hypothetical protein